MLGKIVGGKAFAPLLPADGALATMTDAEFDAALDKWIVAAETGPFV
jgi:hypothetical protein